jgi:uncharacterized protein (TIGR02597 family)
MKTRHIALAVCSIFAANAVFASSSASTNPVGFTRQQIKQGQQTVGITLTNPAVFSATIETASAQALTLDTSDVAIGSVLDDAASYYVEIESGDVSTFVGDRFEIDVTATRARNDATLVLRTSNTNTLSLPLPTGALAGLRASIKRHLTLAQIFGTGAEAKLTPSSDFAQADQVLLFDRATGGFITYYLHRASVATTPEWRRVGSVGSMDNAVIPPGAGIFVRRIAANPVDVVVTGAVRLNDFVLPLAAGYNFVSLPYPAAASPARLQMNCANGFTGASDAAQADQILVFNGAAYDSYFLYRSADGATEAWRKVGSDATNYSTAQLLASSESVFIRKVAADASYVAPSALVR